jgi:hypothetical protein
MKTRFLIAALLLCGLSFEALAAVNVRQNGDGTADFVGSSDSKRFGNCYGGQNIQIPVDLNRVMTGFGVSVVSNAVIRGAYAVTPDATAGDANLQVYVNNQTTPVRFGHATSGGSTAMTNAQIQFRATGAGGVARISTIAEVASASRLIYNTVKEGDYIAVGSPGTVTSQGISPAQVFIQVCPR